MTARVTDGLRALMAKIDQQRFSVRLVEYRKRPAIRVVSLDATTLTDTVIGDLRNDSVTFFWSWGDPLGDEANLDDAATAVMHVLTPQGETPMVQR